MSVALVPLEISVVKQFRRMTVQKFIIQVTTSNSCVKFAGGKLAIIDNIITDNTGEAYIMLRAYQKVCNLYQYPLPSSVVGIYHRFALTSQLHYTLAANIKRKYILLPIKDGFAGLPILHQ